MRERTAAIPGCPRAEDFARTPQCDHSLTRPSSQLSSRHLSDALERGTAFISASVCSNQYLRGPPLDRQREKALLLYKLGEAVEHDFARAVSLPWNLSKVNDR